MDHNPKTKNIDSYTGARPDITKFIKHARLILDVGCNVGAVARALKQQFPACKVWGIEINPDALQHATSVLEAGFCLNLDDHENLEKLLAPLEFDTIIAGDVLEHTADPWKIVEVLYSKLLPDGRIFVSLPNIGHWQLGWNWLRQSWPVNPRGIFDSTHRRFFMRRDLENLAPPGSKFTFLSRTFRFFDKEHPRFDRVIATLLRHVVWLREYFVFQYIFVIQKSICTEVDALVCGKHVLPQT